MIDLAALCFGLIFNVEDIESVLRTAFFFSYCMNYLVNSMVGDL